MPAHFPAPIGTILAYVGDLSSDLNVNLLRDNGWLVCRGQHVTSTDYEDLYTLIANTYGGDSNIFAIPDLRGRFVRGVDSLSQVTNQIGENQEYLTALPQEGSAFTSDVQGDHHHKIPQLPDDYETKDVAAGHDLAAWNSGKVTSSSSGRHTHYIDRGGDKESRPINVYVYYIIKALDVT